MVTYKTFGDLNIGDEVYSCEKGYDDIIKTIFVVKEKNGLNLLFQKKDGSLYFGTSEKDKDKTIVMRLHMGANFIFADERCLEDSKIIFDEINRFV